MIRKVRDHWTAAMPSQFSPKDRQKCPAVLFIGCPDDRGVQNVGGRPGAAQGPTSFRGFFEKLTLGPDQQLARLTIFRGFDVELGESIESAHLQTRNAVRESLRTGVLPIVVGGGHDYGFPHVGGAFDEFNKKVGLLNVDAHLDLRVAERGQITSGSPYWLAIENGLIQGPRFVEFGIQDHCNDESLFRFAKANRIRVVSLAQARRYGIVRSFQQKLDRFTKAGLRIVVSIDLDSIQMAAAPGVSAPQPDGLTPAELFELCEISGRAKSVCTLGIFELAPPLDLADSTSRLAAIAVHRFLIGLSQRPLVQGRPRAR